MKHTDTYNDRPKSKLVIQLIHASSQTKQEVSNKMGISLSYFNNKLTRDSWSFDDILEIAHICGYKIEFKKEKSVIVSKTVIEKSVIEL